MKQNKLFLLLIDGPMGVGKTTVAKLIHEKRSGIAHIGMDRIKKFVSGPKKKAHRNTSKEILKLMTEEYLKSKINVIVEGTLTASRIEKYRKLAKRRGARFFVYQLEAPHFITHPRIEKRTKLLKKPRVTKKQIKKIFDYHSRNKYSKAIILDSSKLSARQIANVILADLR